MKKFLIALILLTMTVNAEMIWTTIDPTVQSSSSSGTIATGISTTIRDDYLAGSILSIRVVDLSANADSSTAIWYSTVINTENVISATGIVEVTICTDTSADGASAFYQYGDSVMAYYTLKTGYIPYDATTDFTLIARAAITATSGTATQVTITLGGEGDEVPDTLFKPYTWFEIELYDSTRWGDLYTQYWRIYGTGDSATTIAGTYNAVGPDFYKYWFATTGGTPDSIGWSHCTGAGVNSGTVDTAAITGSAQNLDSGMTINFDATTGHTTNDTFMFVAADSLWYGKQTDFTIRMGLNVHRR